MTPGQTGRKRLLVLAYYFPPMGMSGVQRVAKLVKYLPQFGWDPVVITVHPGAYFAFDDALEQEVRDAGVEVVRTSSLDPTQPGGRRTVRLGGNRSTWLTRISPWIFIPDNKRGWAPFARAAAEKEHAKQPFDAIFSSAPPYTSHLVARRLGNDWGIPWWVDFRDDWLGNPRHVYPTSLHKAYTARLESRVLHEAHQISAINSVIACSLSTRSGKEIEVVPQGFDPADFIPQNASSNPRCTLLYAGVFYDAQHPKPLLQNLKNLDVTARFIGLVPDDFWYWVDMFNLRDRVEVVGYLPHHEAVREMQRADVLWMMVGHREGAEQISTGKLYDYAGTGKPILGLVPTNGAAAEALKAYGASWVVDSRDDDGIQMHLANIVAGWQSGTLPKPNPAFIRAHDRKELARSVAVRLSQLTEP